MATSKRITDEPAFVLHSYAWSESSLVLEVFCRHHGRAVVVAKGAKKPSSSFRSVLLPLQPLRLTYGGADTDSAEGIFNLKSAQWVGEHTLPTGDALLSGLYLNEILMRVLARSDPHTVLFDAYAGVVRVLAGDHGDALEPVLRSFELLLLREAGVLPALDVQTMTLAPLIPAERYVLVPEMGLRKAWASDRFGLSGQQWIALESALTGVDAYLTTLRTCVPMTAHLKPQLRILLQHHCGALPLRTRQFMVDVQDLSTF